MVNSAEFSQLWKFIGKFRADFNTYDLDSCGKVNRQAIQKMLCEKGYC